MDKENVPHALFGSRHGSYSGIVTAKPFEGQFESSWGSDQGAMIARGTVARRSNGIELFTVQTSGGQSSVITTLTGGTGKIAALLRLLVDGKIVPIERLPRTDHASSVSSEPSWTFRGVADIRRELHRAFHGLQCYPVMFSRARHAPLEFEGTVWISPDLQQVVVENGTLDGRTYSWRFTSLLLREPSLELCEEWG